MNHNTLNPVKNWRQAGLNILPERVVTGTWVCNRSNVDLFIHRRHP
jgi:hypothetical protein